MIITIELTAAIDSAGTTQNLYLATGQFITEAIDTPAHTAFEPRLLDAGTIGVHVYSDGKTGGKTRLETGEILIANIDGELDAWLDYSFDGRPVIIRQGEVGTAYPAGFTILFNGTAEALEADRDKIVIRLRDQAYLFDKPLSQSAYGGTNALPNGLDGTVDDLKGKRKPRIYGQVFNFEPLQVNTSRLVFQLNDGALASVDAVYDRGVALSAGAAYTSQSDMEANAPVAAQYRAWLAGGYIRLGSSPAGQVTVNAAQGAAAGNRTTAQVLKQMALDAGFVAGLINSADMAALDALNSSVVGMIIQDQTILEAMDSMAASIGAYYYIDRTGQYRVGRLTGPGTPVMTFYDYDLLGIERRPSNDVNIPAWKVTLRHAHNETVQTSDLAGSVSDARRAWLALADRTAIYTDSTIKNQWRLAREVEFNGRLTVAIDALNEAQRLLNLYKVKRNIYEITVPVETAVPELMATVGIDYGRFGLSGGVAFRVIGQTLNAVARTVSLTLWG